MSDGTMITAEGLSALRAELEELEGSGRREIAERIRTAREWGDLKENSEYHDAKNEQAHLETKIVRLRERISSAEVVEVAKEDGVVAFGCTVTIEDGSKQRSWKIVSSHDAAPSEGRISADSPVAKALLGLRAGERATVLLPRGETLLRVLSIEAG